MESQPQNPESGIILKTFTHVIGMCVCYKQRFHVPKWSPPPIF